MKNDGNKFMGSVYSTEHGRMCPDCGRPVAQCNCHTSKQAVKGHGMVRVGRETKGRKGKGVTVVTGLPLNGEDLEKLARRLKQLCGAGGTVRDGTIEIQGDHRDQLTAELTKMGYGAKRSGG
jgi:translation initiation factor 1